MSALSIRRKPVTITEHPSDIEVTHSGKPLLRDGKGNYTVLVTKVISGKAMEIVKVFEEFKINTVLYSEKYGRSKSWIKNWKRNGTAEKNVRDISSDLMRTARLLKSTNLAKTNIFDVVEETGVALSTIAERADVSRQSIYLCYERDSMTAAMKERLERAMKSIAADIESRVTKALRA